MMNITQNMLIVTKQYLVVIRFLIFMSKLTVWDFAEFYQFVLSNIEVKNGIFETCFRQAAKGKMTAWEVR